MELSSRARNDRNGAARAMRGALVLAAALLANGCGRNDNVNTAPPRVETKAELPQESSTIVVPISASLAELEQGFNQRVPNMLWSIDKPNQRCVPPKKVKVFGKRVNVTPVIKCDIVGQVTRGRITLGGGVNTLTITMPINARVSARNVAGLANETATGSAVFRATATLGIGGNWQPVAKVRIAYDWTNPPGIDFLGQRIRFADKADAKLAELIARFERELPQELAKIRLREKLAELWPKAFTSVELNERKPPVWMRITPRALGFEGFRIANRQIEMTLAAEALTETFVSGRPPDPTPTPLPPPSQRGATRGLNFFIPVLADYSELEPVLERTLAKRAKKGITLPAVGPVDATFGKATIYATEGGRIAVGIEASVRPTSRNLGTTSGTVWLSAVPYNEPNSQLVRIRDLQIAGGTDSRAVNLLWQLFSSPEVIEDIRTGLSEDFSKDFNKVLGKAQRAIADRREGDFLFSAKITNVTNGLLQVTGQGLFLPVKVQGEANIRYAPLRK